MCFSVPDNLHSVVGLNFIFILFPTTEPNNFLGVLTWVRLLGGQPLWAERMC